MRVVIERDAETAARFAAARIAAALAARPTSVLALAAGSTMLPVYRELVALHAAGTASFSHARAFNLDEYAGLAPDDPRGFRHFVREHLAARVDLPADAHHAPDGRAADLDAECARYEAAIGAAGGLDLAVLGLGRNGHLAFNEPGVSLAARTRVELLMRVDLSGDGHRNPLPRVALTMGIGTILSARACLVVATGTEKERAVAEMIEGPLTAMVPGSALQLHADTTVVLDERASALLVNAAHYRDAEQLRRELAR